MPSGSASRSSTTSCWRATRRRSRTPRSRTTTTAHKSQFGSAEKLNLRIVLAKTQANAKAAQAALKSGQSWDTVAKKYSIDPTTKNNGGLLTGITANEEDRRCPRRRSRHRRTSSWVRSRASSATTCSRCSRRSRPRRRRSSRRRRRSSKTLTTQKQSAAAKAVNTQASNDFKSQTVCVQKWAVAYCSNYVKPKTTSASASAGPVPPRPAERRARLRRRRPSRLRPRAARTPRSPSSRWRPMTRPPGV